jgi:TolB-like protein
MRRSRDLETRKLLKDDLLASVWGGRTVSESTLASRINAARRAVGDTGEQQRLIRTIHGRGFRFVGTIRETEERAASVDVIAVAPSAQAELSVSDRPSGLVTDTLPRSRRGRRASIAVMPFHASSQAAECVADGLSHDIISGLARLRALFVIARGSTFALRDRASNPREIGRLLNVDYVAMGSRADGKSASRLAAALRLGLPIASNVLAACGFQRNCAGACTRRPARCELHYRCGEPGGQESKPGTPPGAWGSQSNST